MEGFDLDPLQRAVGRLREGIEALQRAETDELIRDGVIQRFEYTFELSAKTLRRFLALTSTNVSEVEQMSLGQLIRTANEKDLLRSDWPVWKDYRDNRNKTAHTYNEEVALEVLADIPSFLADAEDLLVRLRERLGEQID